MIPLSLNPVLGSSTGFSNPDEGRTIPSPGINNVPRPIPDEDLPDIVVGILSFNRAEEVLRSLDIFAASDYPPEKLHLLVVDNASGDGTVGRVHEIFGDRVETIALPRNEGAIARNHSMLRRPEQYVFQFDDDCAPLDRDMLRRTVELMEANGDIGAASFRSVNLYSGMTEWNDFQRSSKRRLANGAHEGIVVIGVGMCFRRDAVRQTGGYDEVIHWGAEEYQLSLEFLYHNIPIVYCPHIPVVHRQAPRALSHAGVLEVDMRTNLLASFRYFPLAVALPMVAMKFVRRLAGSAVRRKPGGVEAVLRGVRRALQHLPAVMNSRRVIPLSRIAQHNRWFFATLMDTTAIPAERIDLDVLQRAARSHSSDSRPAPAVPGASAATNA